MKAFCLVTILFLSACMEQSRFPGFINSNTGYHYKFLALGEGDAPAELDFISMEYKLQPYKLGSGPVDPAYLDVKTIQLLPGTAFGNAMARLSQGDSASFIFPSDAIGAVLGAETPENSFYQLDVKILEVTAREKYLEKYRKLSKWLHRPQHSEELQISEYVKRMKPDFFQEDIYFYQFKKGKGKEITDESVVSISYKGYLLDGTVFDQIDVPFTLELKAEEQVIEGLRLAIKRMKKGGEAKIIIPSHLAFGAYGSSNGIVPPNAPVIYELAINEVN